MVLALPEHRYANDGPPVKFGVGLIVSIAWNTVPTQPNADTGVIE